MRPDASVVLAPASAGGAPGIGARRRRGLPLLAAGLLLLVAGCATSPQAPDYGRPLPEGADALLPLGSGEDPPDVRGEWFARQDLLPALDLSIDWMGRPSTLEHFPIAGVSHERARASLLRFRELLVETRSSQGFADAVASEFEVFRSAGWDGRGGGVLFTGYCTPILRGSLTPSSEYRFPLYRLPPDLEKDPATGKTLGRRVGSRRVPYPTRAAIEENGLLADRDLEIAWLADPIDAYLAHVNGSAVIELPDGRQLRLGYAATNGREYSSLRSELIHKGELDPDTAGLPALRRWADVTPESEVLAALSGNERYVFFREIESTPHGSLNLPVTSGRTLATDKTLFPRGALVFVDTRLPGETSGVTNFRRMMLDQDTGGAIRTAGRADIYLGVGPVAERRAGRTKEPGQMYYFFLKDDLVPTYLARAE